MTLLNNSTINLCPPPFLDVASFPSNGGYIAGRFCSDLYLGLTCCLPCPATDWIYTSNFKLWYKVAQVLGAVGLGICVFLLLSWLLLPNERTKSRYLGVCLVIGIALECSAFVIPLGIPHDPCYNSITPNDMTSNLTCAFSGAFLVLGGLVITAWIAIRSLSMHLQICWDVVPGLKFFYFANALGWGFPIAIFVVAMWLTGVSYRFGDTCHINAHHSMPDFWTPILVVAGIAAILQLGTLLYCAKVYLNIWIESSDHSIGSSTLPSFQAGSRTKSAKVVYQRVKKVLWLQWRSVTIVLLLVADVVFFAIVWIKLDAALSSIGSSNANSTHQDNVMNFLTCLVVNSSLDTRSACSSLGQKLLVSENTCIAMLIMLSVTGIQCGLLLSRVSLLKSWVDFFKEKVFHRNSRHHPDFVSLDAKVSDPEIPMNPVLPPITHHDKDSPSISSSLLRFSPSHLQQRDVEIGVSHFSNSSTRNSPNINSNHSSTSMYNPPHMNFSTPNPRVNQLSSQEPSRPATANALYPPINSYSPINESQSNIF